ncbi:hypothetical protein RHS01_07454 [Rhizoctonia solani]|uniref:Uncharacterized protein n=1 Tax=Rhizoctonia solani TaxID=456999 RepID=A0A8H7ICZ2_9AGAM|nr:hypothetical protein RHS01_07454 [Rhizoctonia solani]
MFSGCLFLARDIVPARNIHPLNIARAFASLRLACLWGAVVSFGLQREPQKHQQSITSGRPPYLANMSQGLGNQKTYVVHVSSMDFAICSSKYSMSSGEQLVYGLGIIRIQRRSPRLTVCGIGATQGLVPSHHVAGSSSSPFSFAQVLMVTSYWKPPLVLLCRLNHAASIYGWTQPFCTRCIRSGRQCEGYAPLESPDIKGIMRRGKATPAQKHVPPPRTNVSDQPSDPQTPPLDPNITLSQSSDTDSAFPLSPPDTAPWQPSVLTSGVRYVTEGKGGGLAGRWLESLDPGAGLRSGDGEDRWTDTYGQETRAYETSWPMFHGDDQAMAPNLPSAFISEVAADEELEDDPEGAKYEMCTVPVLDANTVDNTLPFILECSANPMKDTIIAQFMRSPDERPKMILLANVVGSLGRSLRYDARVSQLVDYLRTEAYGNIAKFLSDQPADERERDRQSALAALDLMMEAGQSFRNPWLHAESFAGYPHPTILEANADYLSITTGRPMFFRYDTSYSPQILEMIKDGRYGMQWLHGIADQYIVILAHINVLFEEFGTKASMEHVAEIENQISEVGSFTERSADPVSTVWRYTVRECWKMTMYIYLYMVLCGASTVDSRVLPRVKSFTRLIDAVTPGRNPDSFLYIPMIIVGASSYRQRDRAVIQRRMFGLQECLNPGSCGYDAMNMLIDVWRRTEAENRPAVWYDLRLAAFRVTGI